MTFVILNCFNHSTSWPCDYLSVDVCQVSSETLLSTHLTHFLLLDLFFPIILHHYVWIVCLPIDGWNVKLMAAQLSAAWVIDMFRPREWPGNVILRWILSLNAFRDITSFPMRFICSISLVPVTRPVNLRDFEILYSYSRQCNMVSFFSFFLPQCGLKLMISAV